MNVNDGWILVVQLALGFSLAAACGLRAFLPIFAASALARAGYVTLGTSFEWMGSTPALIVFGSAVVFEIAGDKFPAIDHLLDAAGVVVKPAAATLLASSFLTGIDPLPAAVLSLVTGGAVAGTVHVIKSKVRLGSTLVTAGIGNPVLSILEDVVAFCATALAILVPIVAALVVLMMAAGAFFAIRKLRTRRAPAVVA